MVAVVFGHEETSSVQISTNGQAVFRSEHRQMFWPWIEKALVQQCEISKRRENDLEKSCL